MVPVSGPEAVTKGSTSLAWAHDQWHGPTTQEGKRIPVTPGGASDEVVMAQGVGSGSGEAGLASWVLPESVFQEMHYGPQGPFLGLHAEPHHPRWLQRFGETPAGLEALAVGSHCVVIPLCKLGSVSVERWLEDAHLGNRVSCTLVCPAVLEPTEEAALKEGGFRLEKEWSEEQLGALGWGVQGWYREGDTTHWPSLATKTQEELMPPPKGEISPEEKAKREALKWVEVPTNKAAFVARGDQFSDEVQAWVQGVSIPYMGDPELVEVVQQYPWPTEELWRQAVAEADRMEQCGALHLPTAPVTKVSPWVVVVKGGKTRICVDFSVVVNEHIPDAPFDLPTFKDIEALVTPGCYLAKYDLKDGFWALDVKEADWRLFGVQHPRSTGKPGWSCSYGGKRAEANAAQDKQHKGFRVASKLPFGYKLSPLVFCAVTESIAKVLREQYGVKCLVFVDDFIVVAPSEMECEAAMAVVESLLDELGLIWAPHKKEGPSQCIEFLGIQVDVRVGCMCFRLPTSKRDKLHSELVELAEMVRQGTKTCQAHWLAGIVGRMGFASQVIPGSAVFMRRLWDTLAPAHLHFAQGQWLVKWGAKPLKLDYSLMRDIRWWLTHLDSRNHWAMVTEVGALEVVMGTDASKVGGGAELALPFRQHEMAVKWSCYEQSNSINWLELCMVWWAVWRWVSIITGMMVRVHVDNTTALSVVNKGYARVPHLSEMGRRVWALCAVAQIRLRAKYKPGHLLVRPDCLSRGALPLAPGVRLKPRWVQPAVRWLGGVSYQVGGEELGPGVLTLGTLHWPGDAPLWVHPRFDQVAECLLWVMSMVLKFPHTARALVVLPVKPEAGWWPLAQRGKMLYCVGPDMHSHEAQCKHAWIPHRVAVPVMVVLFPAGGLLQALKWVPAVRAHLLAAATGPVNTITMRGRAWKKATGTDSGSWLWVPFNLEETLEAGWQDGVRMYGWLYQVWQVDGAPSGTVGCEWWAKAMPLDARRIRPTRFVVSDPRQVNGELWPISVKGAYDVTPWVEATKWDLSKNACVEFDHTAMNASRAQAWSGPLGVQASGAMVVRPEPLNLPRGVGLYMDSLGLMFGVDEATQTGWARRGGEAPGPEGTSPVAQWGGASLVHVGDKIKTRVALIVISPKGIWMTPVACATLKLPHHVIPPRTVSTWEDEARMLLLKEAGEEYKRCKLVHTANVGNSVYFMVSVEPESFERSARLLGRSPAARAAGWPPAQWLPWAGSVIDSDWAPTLGFTDRAALAHLFAMGVLSPTGVSGQAGASLGALLTSRAISEMPLPSGDELMGRVSDDTLQALGRGAWVHVSAMNATPEVRPPVVGPVRGKLLGEMSSSSDIGRLCFTCGGPITPGQLTVSHVEGSNTEVSHMTCPVCPVCKGPILMGHHTHTQLINGQLLSVHVGCEAAGDKTDPMVIDLNAAGESPEQEEVVAPMGADTVEAGGTELYDGSPERLRSPDVSRPGPVCAREQCNRAPHMDHPFCGRTCSALFKLEQKKLQAERSEMRQWSGEEQTADLRDVLLVSREVEALARLEEAQEEHTFRVDMATDLPYGVEGAEELVASVLGEREATRLLLVAAQEEVDAVREARSQLEPHLFQVPMRVETSGSASANPPATSQSPGDSLWVAPVIADGVPTVMPGALGRTRGEAKELTEKQRRYTDAYGEGRMLAVATCMTGNCGNSAFRDMQCMKLSLIHI